MNKVSTTETRKNLSDLLNRAAYGHERITVMRKNQPIAAIVPLDDLEAMEALEDAMDIREARERLKEGREGSTTLEEYLDELER